MGSSWDENNGNPWHVRVRVVALLSAPVHKCYGTYHHHPSGDDACSKADDPPPFGELCLWLREARSGPFVTWHNFRIKGEQNDAESQMDHRSLSKGQSKPTLIFRLQDSVSFSVTKRFAVGAQIAKRTCIYELFGNGKFKAIMPIGSGPSIKIGCVEVGEASTRDEHVRACFDPQTEMLVFHLDQILF